VFADAPDVFVARLASPLAIVGFALIVTFVPVLALWGLELLSGLLGARVRRWVHTGFLAFLVAVIAVEIVKRNTPLTASRLVVVGLVAAAAAALLTRLEPVRLWLRYLAAAPLVFAGLFLFTTPIRPLLAEPAGEPANVKVGKPAPVVMVVFDEFPLMSLLDGEGQIDRELYPNFAALAEGSTWYRNDTAVASNTTNAVPAILTGRYPTAVTGPATLDAFPHNLFTLLGGSYDVRAVERFTTLCPQNLCIGGARPSGGALAPLLGDAVDILYSRAAPTRVQTVERLNPDFFGESNAPERVRRFIGSLGRSDRPRLDYVHLLLPHGPWKHLQDGKRYEAPYLPVGLNVAHTGNVVTAAWDDQATADAGRQRHLLQVQYTDAVLGRIVARLRALGTWDESLVVVTADHGVAFEPGAALRGVSRTNYPQILWTPLFIKAPGQQEGKVTDRPTRSIDILPTVADLLDVKLPWAVEGASALRPGPPRSTRLKMLHWQYDQLTPRKGNHLFFSGKRGFEEVLTAPPLRGPGDPATALYRVGRFGPLVGRAVDDLDVGGAAPLTGRLDHAERYDNVDPTADVVPMYISGRLRTKDPLVVAVGVNGVVGGWSEAHATGAARGRGTRTFHTVVPPALLRPGRNDIRLYAVQGTPDAPTLAPVELSG
jgi:hypothetical protein